MNEQKAKEYRKLLNQTSSFPLLPKPASIMRKELAKYEGASAPAPVYNVGRKKSKSTSSGSSGSTSTSDSSSTADSRGSMFEFLGLALKGNPNVATSATAIRPTPVPTPASAVAHSGPPVYRVPAPNFEGGPQVQGTLVPDRRRYDPSLFKVKRRIEGGRPKEADEEELVKRVEAEEDRKKGRKRMTEEQFPITLLQDIMDMINADTTKDEAAKRQSRMTVTGYADRFLAGETITLDGQQYSLHNTHQPGFQALLKSLGAGGGQGNAGGGPSQEDIQLVKFRTEPGKERFLDMGSDLTQEQRASVSRFNTLEWQREQLLKRKQPKLEKSEFGIHVPKGTPPPETYPQNVKITSKQWFPQDPNKKFYKMSEGQDGGLSFKEIINPPDKMRTFSALVLEPKHGIHGAYPGTAEHKEMRAIIREKSIHAHRLGIEQTNPHEFINLPNIFQAERENQRLE